MIKFVFLSVAMVVAFLPSVFAQYPEWTHTGDLTILTTPEGANLPTGSSVEGFPLLVRLHKDWFDFKQAKAHGEDVRFSTVAGLPLAYQVEEWDAAKGTASIWVASSVLVCKFPPMPCSSAQLGCLASTSGSRAS